tara:strand:+ start:86 stop:1366 length:1281 start_codon:yes stop_codon:yes gene_type:complete
MLNKWRTQAGFAIVEVLVATVVLAIGFLELARAFRNINSVAVQAVAMTKASNLANATMERVMAQDFDARGNEANGKSLNFDGPDEYIDTGVPLQDTFRNSFTVSYWVKPDDGNPASAISIFGTINSADEEGVRSNISTDGKIDFFYESNNVNAEAITSSAVFSDGATAWTHVALVADSGANLLIYINGNSVVITGGSLVGIDMSIWTSSDDVFIGATDDAETAVNHFVGDIDEVRIWSVTRSAASIKADYKKRINDPFNTDNLDLYYPMNNGTGSVAFDHSVNKNHGSLENMENDDWVTGYSTSLGKEYIESTWHGLVESAWSGYNDVDDFHTVGFIDSDYDGLDEGSPNFSGLGGRVYVKYISLNGGAGTSGDPYTFNDSVTPTDYKQITVKVGIPGTTDSTQVDAIKSAKVDQGYPLTFSPYGS